MSVKSGLGNKIVEYKVRSEIKECRCGRRFIPTHQSSDTCLFCYKIDLSLSRIRSPESPLKKTGSYQDFVRPNWRESRKKWLAQQGVKEHLKKYRRNYKKEKPWIVKAYNKRFYEKNYESKLGPWFKSYYKLKKYCIMKAVNNRIVVAPLIKAEKEQKTDSGIFLTTDIEQENITWGEVKFVCDKPTEPVKKKDIVGYMFSIPFKAEGSDLAIVEVKDILIIK